jgi:hypothetical protein
MTIYSILTPFWFLGPFWRHILKQNSEAIVMMIIIMMNMSMRWDYVSQLRPPTGLLFISQVIHKHGEPWLNDIDKGKLLIHPLEFSGNTTSHHLVTTQKEMEKKMILALWSILVHTLKGSLTRHEILWYGADSFMSPLKEGMLWFSSPLKIQYPWPDKNPWTLAPKASTLTITLPWTKQEW